MTSASSRVVAEGLAAAQHLAHHRLLGGADEVGADQNGDERHHDEIVVAVVPRRAGGHREPAGLVEAAGVDEVTEVFVVDGEPDRSEHAADPARRTS